MMLTTPAPRDLSLPQWRPASRGAFSSSEGSRRQMQIGYLRLSITRGCSMRCTYCRPELDRGHDPSAMAADDYRFLAGHLHKRLGLRKVRITGGEPTLRRDVFEIIAALREVGVADIAMTTNGLMLGRDAFRLRDAGLDRANVSLDSLNRERFSALTGVDGLHRVLDGIDSALSAGLTNLKLNTVVVANQNECDLSALVTFAADRKLVIRFIELMPMGPLADVWQDRYVPAERMRMRMNNVVRRWVSDRSSGEVTDAARMWTAELRNGQTARVGFITPMSQHFCDTCDRLRITANGDIYPCLMDEARGNLRDATAMRDSAGIDEALDRAYEQKQKVHPPVAPGIMTHLGG